MNKLWKIAGNDHQIRVLADCKLVLIRLNLRVCFFVKRPCGNQVHNGLLETGYFGGKAGFLFTAAGGQKGSK